MGNKTTNESSEMKIIIKMASAVTDIVKKYIKKAHYTWEFKTKVLSYEGDYTYKIKYLNVEHKAVSAYQFDVGTMVRVIVPNNQFNDIYLVPYQRCKGFIG